jgi:hypothetical protein
MQAGKKRPFPVMAILVVMSALVVTAFWVVIRAH